MTVLTIELDPQMEAALADLTVAGDSPETVIRRAVLAAWRLRRNERIREQAEAIAADPDDRAEIMAIQRELDELRAWCAR
jgi:predicted transcriptional regulator